MQVTTTPQRATTPLVDPSGSARRTLRLSWLLAVLAFFAMGAGWALALPVNGSYDEKQHIVRAYAVARGDWQPDGSAVDEANDRYEAFAAPRSLLPLNPDCTWRPPRRAGDCLRWDRSDRTVLLPSAAARYSPVYYLPVGVPLVVSPTETGIIWARMVSALLGALLLGSAVQVGVWLRSRLLVASVILVGTPLAISLNGAVNPNGLEISAGVLFAAALLGLLRGPDPDADPRLTRRLLLLTGVSGALLLTVRHMGPLLLVLAAAACLLVAVRGRVRALLAHRRTRTVLGGFLGAGLLFAVVWILTSRVVSFPPDVDRAKHLSTGELLHQIATIRIPFYTKQTIGQFGYGETVLSTKAVALYYLLFLAVLVPALLAGGWRVRVAVVGLIGVCLAILVGLELWFVPRVGWYSHGRYAMPAAAAAVLIAATAWRRTAPGWFVAALVLVAAPLHLYALVRVMSRFQVGMGAWYEPFHGFWLPPGGPWTVLAVEVVGLLLLLATVGLVLRRTAGEGSTVARGSH